MAVVGALTMAANAQASEDIDALFGGKSIPTNGVVSTTVSSSSSGYSNDEKDLSSVFGGVKVTSTDTNDQRATALSSIKSTSVTVENGNWDKVVGGNSFKTTPGGTQDALLKPFLTTSSVTIGKDVGTVFQLAGGSHESGITSKSVQYLNLTGEGERTTSVAIDGGTFGRDYNTDNKVVEQFVVAGDAIKVTVAAGNNSGISTVKSTLSSTTMTITGGTFNSPVVGGSMAMAYSQASYKGYNLDATVAKTKVEISGGTFNHAVTAAGYASGLGNGESNVASSKVGTAELVVKKGATFKEGADIFAGGIANQYGTAGVTKESNITIDGAEVQGIYGTVGYVTLTKE